MVQEIHLEKQELMPEIVQFTRSYTLPSRSFSSYRHPLFVSLL